LCIALLVLLSTAMARLTQMSSLQIRASHLVFKGLALNNEANDDTWAAAFAIGGGYNCTTDQTQYLSQECQASFQSTVFSIVADPEAELNAIVQAMIVSDTDSRANYDADAATYCSSDCRSQIVEWNAHYADDVVFDEEGYNFCPIIIQYLMGFFVVDDSTGDACAFSDMEAYVAPISTMIEEYLSTGDYTMDCSNVTTCSSFHLQTLYTQLTQSASYYNFGDNGEDMETISAFLVELMDDVSECSGVAGNDKVCSMVEDGSSSSGSDSSGSDSSNSGSITSENGAAEFKVLGTLLVSIASILAFA